MTADPCSPYCPFRGCSTCDYQGGNTPVEEPVDTPTFPHHHGRIEAQHKSGPGGAGNTVIPGPNPWIGGAMGKPTHNHPPHSILEPAPPLPAHDVAMKALLRLAKFVDATVTKDDGLLSQLEAGFSSGSLTRTSHAAERILHCAEAASWGGGA